MDLAINSMAMTMQDHHGGLISPLDATENGTYAADGLTVDGYSPVNVNVASSSLLPAGYTQIEYIEIPNRTQVIGFGLPEFRKFNKGQIIESRTMPYEVDNGDENAFLGYPDMIEFYYENGKQDIWISANYSSKASDIVGAKNVSINNIYLHRLWIEEGWSLDYNLGQRLYIGYYRDNRYRFAGRIYSIKIYDFSNNDIDYADNILVCNLVPCIENSTNKVGMYNTITEIFSSSTTGNEFVAPLSN